MKSPAHQSHPEHKIVEKKLDRRVRIEVGGQVLADSRNVLEVDEDGSPPRFYFPRSDVRMDRLVRTKTTSVCPYKGTAHYYSVQADGHTLDDVVWSYEKPYDEHLDLTDRVAFWEERSPEIVKRVE